MNTNTNTNANDLRLRNAQAAQPCATPVACSAQGCLDPFSRCEEAAPDNTVADDLPPLPEPLEIDWPNLNRSALGCGVEDRGIHDRYAAAEYGWEDGVERAIERVPEQIYDAEQMQSYARAAILATRQPAPVASAPAFPPSRCLFIAGDEPTVFNGIALDAGQRLYVLDGEPVAPQPAAAPVAADVAQGAAVLQSLLDEAREDNARLKAKLVIATTKPPADAAPALTAKESDARYTQGYNDGWSEGQQHMKDQGHAAPVDAKPVDMLAIAIRQVRAAEKALSSVFIGGKPDPHGRGHAFLCQQLYQAIDWLEKQAALAQRAAIQDSERDAALLTTRTMDGWNFIEPTHTAAEDMRDAARYRWLRDVGDETWKPMAQRVTAGGIGIDAAIDAALAAQQGVKGGA